MVPPTLLAAIPTAPPTLTEIPMALPTLAETTSLHQMTTTVPATPAALAMDQATPIPLDTTTSLLEKTFAMMI